MARITTLLGVLPAALGQTTKSASFPVTWASDQGSLSVVPTQGTLTDRSATVGASSNQLMAANNARKYLIIQNVSTSNIGFIFGAGPATLGQGSYILPPQGSFVMEGSFVSTQAIQAIGAVGSQGCTAGEA